MAATEAVKRNARYARRIWGGAISVVSRRTLEELTIQHSLSVASGDLLYLEGKWYVTHVGLLRLARRSHCAGIRVQPVHEFCDPKASRWAFKATVYKSRDCKG